MFLAATDIAREVDNAFLWIGGTCLLLLVGVTVTMLWFVFRYHHTRHKKAAQIEGNLALEITWIAIPTVLVIWMFFKGYEGFKVMRNVPPDAMQINVIAQSWFWTFEYPDDKIVTDRLVLPIDTSVRFNLSSKIDDVTHSFYLPDYRVKEDCVPGRDTHMWIHTQTLGTFNIFCAEFCGKDHALMVSSLEVVTPEEYELWKERMIAEQNKPLDMTTAIDPESEAILARDADQLYATYCATCHGENGMGGLVEGARNFTTNDDWTNGNSISGIYQTLTEGIPGGQMRSFSQLSKWDRMALVHKVRSYYRGDDLVVDTSEALAELDERYELTKQTPVKRRLPIERAMQILTVEQGGEGGAEVGAEGGTEGARLEGEEGGEE